MPDRRDAPKPLAAGGGAMGVIGDKEKYAATVQLLANADSGRWNRFSHFLVLAGALFAGWNFIHIQANPPPGALVVKALLCVFGFASGLFWAATGHRCRRFVST
jgi:hypothetical protein